MKKIIVGFSRPIKATWFSRAIQCADKTPYDHVYIKWTWAAVERDIIYQASKFSVNFESNLTFNSHALTIEEYEVQIGEEAHKKIMQFCMDNSNKPYSLKQIFGFAYVKLAAMIGQKVHNPFPTHGNSYVCSKIAAEILAMTDTVKIDASFDDIDPRDMNLIIAAAAQAGLVKKIV